MAETNEPESANNSSELPEGWVEIQPNFDPAWFTPEGWEESEEEELVSKVVTNTTNTTIQALEAPPAEELMAPLSNTYPESPPFPVKQEGETQDEFDERMAGWNKHKMRDTLIEQGWKIVNENGGGGCVITGAKPQMTVIDLNELEAGQPNWLSVIAKQKAEAKREAHKKKLLAEAKVRFQERRKRERKKGDGP